MDRRVFALAALLLLVRAVASASGSSDYQVVSMRSGGPLTITEEIVQVGGIPPPASPLTG